MNTYIDGSGSSIWIMLLLPLYLLLARRWLVYSLHITYHKGGLCQVLPPPLLLLLLL